MLWIAFGIGVLVGASGLYALVRFVLKNWAS